MFLYYYSNSDIDNPYKDEFQILTSIKKSIVQIFYLLNFWLLKDLNRT